MSCLENIYLKVVAHLKNFAKFEKHLCRSLLFNKVASWMPPTFLRKDSETEVVLWILWNYISNLISKWRKVCLHQIYCSFIWFTYIRIKNKRIAFNSFTNSKWNSLWFLTIYYSLGSPCYILSDNNTSACTHHFCDKSLSRFFIFHRAFLIKNAIVISKFMTLQTGQQVILTHMLPSVSRGKGNQTLKFGQIIKYIMRNIFLLQSCRKWSWTTSF